jgi:hypothetical protein
MSRAFRCKAGASRQQPMINGLWSFESRVVTLRARHRRDETHEPGSRLIDSEQNSGELIYAGVAGHASRTP